MQKDKKFSAFVEYCKQLATEHIYIRHSDTEKHFYRFELEEVLTGLSDMHYPALILEGYRFAFKDARSDNPIKVRSGGFILLSHVSDASDYVAVHEVWDLMEEIGDDILARIKADKRVITSPVYGFDIESVSATLIQNELDNTYGIRFLFDIDCQMSLDVDSAKWVVATEAL